MSYEEEMNIDEIRKYLHKIRFRYWKGTKKEKGLLLDEMEAVTKLHRKHLIRLITGRLERKKRIRQRGREYGADVDDAVRVIARSLDYPCAERLRGNLVWMADHLVQHGEMRMGEGLREKLERISVSTLRRTQVRVQDKKERIAFRRGPRRCGVNRAAREVSVQNIPWGEEEAGHFEVDLVHHSDDPSGGQYVHTIQMLDVATGWSECAAVLGRSYRVVKDGFERMSMRLPFAVREIHSDNGREFLNDHLLRFWKDKYKGLKLSRSRPFRKNDNRFVEENNHSLVRAYVGHARMDTVEHTQLLNVLYDKLWWYHNFFQPFMHLVGKKEIISAGGQKHIKRIYDNPRPPFDRLCEKGILEPTLQAKLQKTKRSINPLQLRSEIEALIHSIYSLPKAKPGESENVYDSLFRSKSHQKGEDISVALSFDRTMTLG